MAYSFKTLAIDNSAVNTRQVRRQRERLAAKGHYRTLDTPPGRLMGRRYSSSKYMPHIGAKERARHG